ncbi:hypothetical protein, partial [Enterobacter intestinihominis]
RFGSAPCPPTTTTHDFTKKTPIPVARTRKIPGRSIAIPNAWAKTSIKKRIGLFIIKKLTLRTPKNNFYIGGGRLI